MNANEELISRFYQALQKRDGDAMAACYHPGIHFSDPAFPDLRGVQAGAMWRMLCERGKDLRVEFRDVAADDRKGNAHWEAWYSFSRTGRAVHNVIEAEFEFREGLIVRHIDRFDFHRWAAQALGLSGKLLGGTGFLKRKVQAQAGKGLAEFSRSS